MITSFLIATLILFSLNTFLNIISLGIIIADRNDKKIVQASVAVFIYLVFITWNIFALTSL